MTDPTGLSAAWTPDREALLRTTLALTVDERVSWLEQMMAIAIESSALPKPVPDQERGRQAASE
jgi:hypothetical protein